VCVDNGQDGEDNASNKDQHSTAAADSDKAGDRDKDADDDDELNLLNEDDVAKLGLMTVTLEQQKGKQHMMSGVALPLISLLVPCAGSGVVSK